MALEHAIVAYQDYFLAAYEARSEQWARHQQLVQLYTRDAFDAVTQHVEADRFCRSTAFAKASAFLGEGIWEPWMMPPTIDPAKPWREPNPLGMVEHRRHKYRGDLYFAYTGTQIVRPKTIAFRHIATFENGRLEIIQRATASDRLNWRNVQGETLEGIGDLVEVRCVRPLQHPFFSQFYNHESAGESTRHRA